MAKTESSGNLEMGIFLQFGVLLILYIIGLTFQISALFYITTALFIIEILGGLGIHLLFPVLLVNIAFPQLWLKKSSLYPTDSDAKMDGVQEDNGHYWNFIEPRSQTRKTIVAFHGNMGTIRDSFHFWEKYSYTREVNVLLIEYPGYLSSHPTLLTSSRIKSHIYASFWMAVGKHGISLSDLYIHGKSIGSCVATWLYKKLQRADREPRALCLVAPPKSPLKIKIEYTSKIARKLDRFKTESIFRKLTFNSPVWIIAMNRDSVIPLSHGRELRDLADYCAMYIELAGCHNKPDNVDEYMNILDTFAQVTECKV
jgi:hypothetical protein